MGHTPMHLAAAWPAGVSILLNAGAKDLVNQPDNVGFFPVAYASYSECLAAVQLLVGADSALYRDEEAVTKDYFPSLYPVDLLWDAISQGSKEMAKCILQALIDRRRRLAEIASQELPNAVRQGFDLSLERVIDASAARVCKLLKQNHTPLPPGLLVPSGWQTIYHLLSRDTFPDNRPFESLTYFADLFYNAGFHDFIEDDERRRNPFMQDFFIFKSQHLDLCLWFIRKGLTLEYKEFRKTDEGDWIPHTPGAFYIGKSLVGMLSKPEAHRDSTTEMQLRSLLTKVVGERTPDDCKCACSINGCHALTSMLKEWKRYQMFQKRDGNPYHFTILLINMLDIANDEWSFLPATILRFLTFERLELTHTCCVYKRYWDDGFAVFDDGDRIEIQEEESADLNELETLMLEFQRAYTDLGVPLPEFLQRYWTTRMDEVMSGEEATSEDEASRIRELGVIWDPRATPRRSSMSSTCEDGYQISPPSRTETGGKRRHSC